MKQGLRRCLMAVSTLLSGSMTALPASAGNTAALLAVSWQPAFCETHRAKPECRTQGEDRFDAQRFSLHGLWPLHAEYCGVDAETRKRDQAGDWLSLPLLNLSRDTRARLDMVMPGSQSGLQRHEWVKHGTCTGLTPEAYYRRSLDLMDELNGSDVARLFAANIGRYLSETEIRNAFVSSFGEGADRRVKMKCDGQGRDLMITEITIGLSRDYKRDFSLAELIQGAGETSFGCAGGFVDPAGYD